MAEVVINGETREFAPENFPRSVAALCAALRLAPETVAAEVDGTVVVPSAFGEERIKSGSTVELVRLVGGG